MFSGGSSSRKPLIRQGSSGGGVPSMRNWPLFSFLFALVFFFYLFYVYQSQSAEFALLREQFDQTNAKLRAVQSQLVDTRASLEAAASDANTCKTAIDSCKTKYDDCSQQLRSQKLSVDQLTSDKAQLSEKEETEAKELATLREKTDELTRENTGLNQLKGTQESLIAQLNETVHLLRAELEPLKAQQQRSAAPANPESAQAQVAVAAASTTNASTVSNGDSVKVNGVGVPPVVAEQQKQPDNVEGAAEMPPANPGDRVKMEAARDAAPAPVVVKGDYKDDDDNKDGVEKDDEN